jgi:hypothetical protein
METSENRIFGVEEGGGRAEEGRIFGAEEGRRSEEEE